MRKQKQTKPETPQRFSWFTVVTVDTFSEASAAKDKFIKSGKKQPVRIHLQRGRYVVKMGEPVKAKPQPTLQAAE